MSDLMHILRAVIREELRALRLGDIAVVTAIMPHAADDHHNYECNVKLRELDLELRNVPIATPHIGMVSAPREGDLVLLSYVGGDVNRPIVVGRLYSDGATPPVHAAKTSLAIDKDQSVVITAGKNIITVKQDDIIEISGEADLKLEVKGDVQIKCSNAKIDASGDIDLGEGGGGVITDKTHKCYFTGAPLVGSPTVKAKG